MSHCSPVCGKHIVAYADKEDVTPCPVCGLQIAKEEIAALRAELAAERARLDWLNSVDGMDWFSHCDYGTATRVAIDAAMKEDGK